MDLRFAICDLRFAIGGISNFKFQISDFKFQIPSPTCVAGRERRAGPATRVGKIGDNAECGLLNADGMRAGSALSTPELGTA